MVERVKTLTAATARPTLTDDEVTTSIQAYPMEDRDCLTPEDVGWTQTWDINQAVAELWGVKAGKVAGDFNFQADQAQYSKGDVMAHCLAMQAKYAARVGGSADTSRYGGTILGNVVVNG